ncbi:MAG: heavy metal translocating P-type ATPase [Candidatus Bipolaricaulia bacterium]
MSKESTQAKEHTEDLEITGLHCVNCANELQEMIGQLEGVSEAQMYFNAGKLRVRYDEGKIDHTELIQQVSRIGYTARQSHTETVKEPSPFWKRRDTQVIGIAGLWLLVGLSLSFSNRDPTLATLGNRSLSLSTFFYLGAILSGGSRFARGAWHALHTVSLDIDFLMAVAIVGAVAISEYVEAASLAVLFALAELLEEYSVDRARNSLRELMKLVPDEARVLRDGEEVSLPIDGIGVGEIIAVRPGERIALDGRVVQGRSAVNQAAITGESMPVDKGEGDEVYAGSINAEGYLEVEVTKPARESTLAKIIRLVEEAEANKASSERFVEKFGRYYTPTMVAVAVGVAAVPPLFLAAPFTPWFLRAITLLVIACPCALLISTPVSVVSAVTSAARNGVLIKGGVYLEAMGGIRAIAIDKTGTLTTGQLEVTDVIPFNSHSAEEVLQVAAALECRSQHPIAEAIVRRYEQTAQERLLQEPTDFESLTGQGVRARLDGQVYMVGKLELFSNAARPAEFTKLEAEAKTVVVVGTPDRLMGLVAIADRLRPEAEATINQLQRLGLEVVMITGDNEGTAKAVAKRLGIDHYHAGVLPEDKVAEIQKLLKQYGKVAMVGDGVNDAPALATATVGIAMGTIGTDTALETADVALMSDDLSKLPYLMELSRKARRVIQNNIKFSILLKFGLATGVFLGYVTLVLAVLVGDMGASLTVTGNALRLARMKPTGGAQGITTDRLFRSPIT